MTEQEKRLHRCCFSGHRPEKLRTDEATIKAWLEKQVDQAIADGYTTFITGMAMGVDLWAGQIVVERRRSNSSLHLIAAVPWPGFAAKWKDQWKGQYETVLHAADLVINVREAYEKNVFQLRNEWMVNHSQRIIAYFNGERGGTLATIDYALKSHIELCAGEIVPDFSSYVAYDFETTGLSADKDEIIEIGAVRVVNSKEVETFQAFAKPERKEISTEITKLTGITPYDVAESRSPREVLDDFLKFVGKDVMVGFNNIGFDSRFIEAAGMKPKNWQFDVMLYAMQFQRTFGFERPRVSLRTLSERLNITNPQAHRALADAMTTARCLEMLKSI